MGISSWGVAPPPHDFPPFTTVNYHYMKFVRNNLFERLNEHLREAARVASELKKTLGVLLHPRAKCWGNRFSKC